MLIDFDRINRLMIRYRVGIHVKRTVQIVEIDEDFFTLNESGRPACSDSYRRR